MLALLPEGLGRTVWAVIAAHVVFNLAVVVRIVGAVWEHLPHDMEWAAATLGASPGRTFREVTLPLLRPALTAAAAIVVLFTFTSFGVIRVLAAPGTRTIEVEIWRRATQLGQIDVAAVLALVQLATLAVVIAWTTMSQKRHSRALDLSPWQRRRPPRRGAERRWVHSIVLATAVVACAPLAALVVRSFSTPTGWSTGAWTGLGRTEVRPGIRLGLDPTEAIWNSVRTMMWATLFAVVIGALASLAIAAAGRGGRILDVGLMLPVGTSAVTIGFGMLITFDRDPFDWRAAWWLVPVGHALVAIPFVVRTVLGILRAVDPALVSAASTLGASPTRAWWEVVVPFLWRPLAVAAALAAAISLGEFGATSFLSRTGGETMPIAIERLLGRTGSLLQAQGYVLATLLAALTVLLVVAVDAFSPGSDRVRRQT
jgi:thiamine transport system permease protein